MNLIEGVQEEMNRLRDVVIPAYEEIGAPGAFAVAIMKASIKNAEKIIATGDVIQMVQIYGELKSYQL
jgi:hypothetical protein